jgi:aminopeptidase N
VEFLQGDSAGRSDTMQISMRLPFSRTALILLLAATGTAPLSVAFAETASPVGSGVSQELAIARAARISNLRYQLHFAVKEHATAIDGTETVFFVSKSAGDLAIDYRDGELLSATLNGETVPLTLENGHLHLAARAGENKLVVSFRSNAAAAGKAITRYEDKDDGSEYFYTLFVPMDASMAFPCFDQPDLKGRFTLEVEHPQGWTVIGNTAAVVKDETHSAFSETRPISTYLFAFAAGPFVPVAAKHSGEPTIYVRKSQQTRAIQEAPQVQQITARGVTYLSNYFAQPFPFPKYDLVLIPGFPFGGMEHAGETFLNEDAVLFRSTPTENDYFRRNILVLHETCHQWFGDLVTMRWFNDLWLKEGFAQYMAYKALTELEPESNAWKHFSEEIKPLAYGIDETQGTTPIFQKIANLKDAKSAYGAIVYQKAPAVLKQLDYFLGDVNFRDGLRLYLKQHAYANAEWADLVEAFATASKRNGAHLDVKGWAENWITHRGMPEVTVSRSCDGGKISSFTIHQRDVLNEGHLWPMANEIVFLRDGAVSKIKVQWSTAGHEVTEAIGKPCPNLVFANDGDYGYGRFLLDPASADAAALLLVPGRGANSGDLDPLRRSMLWGALWANVHVAQSAPRGFLELAQKALASETDESLAQIDGGRVATVLHAYFSDVARKAAATAVEAIVADRMLHAPTLGLRIVNFRTFTGVAETPAALAQVKNLLSGKLVVPGLTLKPLDRWNLVGHLIAMNDSEAPQIYAAEQARDHSGEGQKYAYAAMAGAPNAEVKSKYWDEYLHSSTVQEDWITQSLRPFNSWNQSALTAPYLTQALNQLPEIKLHRKIFFLGAWLGSFVDGQKSPEAQAAVHAWLAGASIDPDLRLKVLEVSDALDRTVMIRKRFPE